MPKPIPVDVNTEPVERVSLDELRALQLDRLRWSLHHAYANVPHYRTAFDAAGVHPDDVKDRADLAKLPFTSKHTLRDNFPFGMFAVPREQVLRVHASSGTTGRPTVVGYTKNDLDTWAVVAARSMRAAGARPGDIVHIAVNYRMFTGGFGAEPWTNKMRQSMEERTDFHAIDTYGLSELIGPGVAAESFETKDGPHVWEDHFYPEVIDPDTGEVLPDGQPGELVLTSLTKEAMPVIRYRTRDLTRLLPGTAFGAMRRIEKVIGRSDDMMIVRAVNVFPTQLEEFLLREPELTPHFQCHLDREGNMDTLLVKVERRPSVSADSGDAAGERFADRGKHLIGIRIGVEVSGPGTVERSAGKMRRVIDHRENM